MHLTRTLGVLLLGVFCVNCGKNDDDQAIPPSSGAPVFDPATGFATNGVGQLNIALLSSGRTDDNASLALADIDPKLYSTTSILSGAPEDFYLYVKLMTLSDSSDPSASVPIFQSEEGKPLRVTGTKVDMSNFFTQIGCVTEDGDVYEENCPCGLDADGSIIEQVEVPDAPDGSGMGCPIEEEVARSPVAYVPVSQLGEFDTLSIEFANKVTASGCVSGYIKQPNYGDSDILTDDIEFERYCTKAAMGVDEAYAGTTKTSDFVASATQKAEQTQLSLELDPSRELALGQYPIAGGVTLTASGDSPMITMVIDTSTMLRFFKRENRDNKTHPDGDKNGYGGSFFFINRFTTQNFVFVGEPGEVRGYFYRQRYKGDEGPTSAFPAGSDSNLSLLDCGETCQFHATGWLSVIYDALGEPLLFSLQPDDNNVGLKTTNTSDKGIQVDQLEKDGTFYDLVQADVADNSGDTWSLWMHDLDLNAQLADTFTSTYKYENDRASVDNEENIKWWGALEFTRKL